MSETTSHQYKVRPVKPTRFECRGDYIKVYTRGGRGGAAAEVTYLSAASAAAACPGHPSRRLLFRASGGGVAGRTKSCPLLKKLPSFQRISKTPTVLRGGKDPQAARLRYYTSVARETCDTASATRGVRKLGDEA